MAARRPGGIFHIHRRVLFSLRRRDGGSVVASLRPSWASRAWELDGSGVRRPGGWEHRHRKRHGAGAATGCQAAPPELARVKNPIMTQ